MENGICVVLSFTFDMAGFYVELNQSVVSEAGQNSASVSLIIKPDNTLL